MSQTNSIHIVAIDDEQNILKLVKGILGRDYTLTTFNTPEAALAALSDDTRPDLIICDISMPNMSGFELHEAVRDIPALRSVPFIYLTALDDRENYRKGMLQGADDYLTKPFTPVELREAVAGRLARTNSLRNNTPELIISSLGGVSLSVAGERLQWEAKKVAELLMYLMTANNRVLLRQVRSDLWWGDVAENSVHVLINRLRKTSDGVAELSVDGDYLLLNLKIPYQWDAETFEQQSATALEKADYPLIENAISQYKGGFLPGFDSPWSENRRQHYEQYYAQLLELSVEVAPNDEARLSAEQRLRLFLDVEDI